MTAVTRVLRADWSTAQQVLVTSCANSTPPTRGRCPTTCITGPIWQHHPSTPVRVHAGEPLVLVSFSACYFSGQ
jgi:hypothetical protein